MTTQPTKLLVINTNKNTRIHGNYIQGIIDYSENNINTEPGRDIETY